MIFHFSEHRLLYDRLRAPAMSDTRTEQAERRPDSPHAPIQDQLNQQGRGMKALLGFDLRSALTEKNIATEAHVAKVMEERGLDTREKVLAFIAEDARKGGDWDQKIVEAESKGLVTKEIALRIKSKTRNQGHRDYAQMIKEFEANMEKWQPRWQRLEKTMDDCTKFRQTVEAKLGRKLTKTELPSLGGIEAGNKPDRFEDWEKLHTQLLIDLIRYEKLIPELEKKAGAKVRQLVKKGLAEEGDEAKWISWLKDQKFSPDEYRAYVDYRLETFLQRTTGSEVAQHSKLLALCKVHGQPTSESSLSKKEFLELGSSGRKLWLLSQKQAHLERDVILQRKEREVGRLESLGLVATGDVKKWRSWMIAQDWTNDELSRYDIEDAVDRFGGGNDAKAYKQAIAEGLNDASIKTIDAFNRLSAGQRKAELQRVDERRRGGAFGGSQLTTEQHEAMQDKLRDAEIEEFMEIVGKLSEQEKKAFLATLKNTLEAQEGRGRQRHSSTLAGVDTRGRRSSIDREVSTSDHALETDSVRGHASQSLVDGDREDGKTRAVNQKHLQRQVIRPRDTVMDEASWSEKQAVTAVSDVADDDRNALSSVYDDPGAADYSADVDGWQNDDQESLADAHDRFGEDEAEVGVDGRSTEFTEDEFVSDSTLTETDQRSSAKTVMTDDESRWSLGDALESSEEVEAQDVLSYDSDGASDDMSESFADLGAERSVTDEVSERSKERREKFARVRQAERSSTTRLVKRSAHRESAGETVGSAESANYYRPRRQPEQWSSSAHLQSTLKRRFQRVDGSAEQERQFTQADHSLQQADRGSPHNRSKKHQPAEIVTPRRRVRTAVDASGDERSGLRTVRRSDGRRVTEATFDIERDDAVAIRQRLSQVDKDSTLRLKGKNITADTLRNMRDFMEQDLRVSA